jgi:Stress responsive A/B Barrel Domain
MKTFLHLAAILVAMTLSTIAADKPSASKKLYHVVSFKFKADAKKEQIDGVVAAFRDLKKKIPAIQEFSWGTNVSPEKHDKGFTHAFILSFGSEKDRDTYLVHPDHKAFGGIVGPVLADVFVIDYWAQE